METYDEQHDAGEISPTAAEPVAAPEDDRSALAWLRKRREELRGSHYLTLEIPGWSGRLVCRYKPVEGSRMEKITARHEKLKGQGDRHNANLALAADTLIASCDEFLFRGDDHELRPLSEEAGSDRPIRYEERLADLLGFEAKTARDVLFGVFPRDEAGAVVGPMVMGHAGRVANWMSGVDEEVGDEMVGET